eukprot:1523201-Alexandrium_andersonii.AAC.1
MDRSRSGCYPWIGILAKAVSVRLGRRGPPMAAFPLHSILHSDSQTTEVGPSIEDRACAPCGLQRGLRTQGSL